jgi:DNA invertase Pin-like site-specific DNA recombinase
VSAADAIREQPAPERFALIDAEKEALRELRDATIRELRASGTPIAQIARLAGLSRQAIYDIGE